MIVKYKHKEKVVYKVGDYVTCLPGFQSDEYGKPNYGGAGYEEDKLFIVANTNIDINGRGVILWPKRGSGGIYAYVVRYATDDEILGYEEPLPF